MLIHGLIGIVGVFMESVANKKSAIEHLPQMRQCL
jgi:hypothetical protein